MLEGIRAVDLTSMWAGPLCTRILADLGAEVIKIEAPGRPDGTRANPGHFSWLNRNKLGMTLDLNNSEAKKCLGHLVEKSDVIVENFAPRVMRNFGLDYPVLREVKPEIIMLSMPAYGSSGPYRDYVAYGPGMDASSGLAALTGYTGGPPMLSGSAYADPVAGLHGAVAVLAALRHRRKCGKGQWIDLAQREALSQMFGEAFLLAAAGVSQPRVGNRHPTFAPQGCYRCMGHDRWVAISIRSDTEWEKLCRVMGKDALAEDPRYSRAPARKAREDDLDKEIEEWSREWDAQEAVALLQASGLAAGMVMDARDLSLDPHLTARGFWETATIDGQVSSFPGLPWRTSRRPEATKRPAPSLGEHNHEILSGLLQLSQEQIARITLRQTR